MPGRDPVVTLSFLSRRPPMADRVQEGAKAPGQDLRGPAARDPEETLHRGQALEGSGTGNPARGAGGA